MVRVGGLGNASYSRSARWSGATLSAMGGGAEQRGKPFPEAAGTSGNESSHPREWCKKTLMTEEYPGTKE